MNVVLFLEGGEVRQFDTRADGSAAVTDARLAVRHIPAIDSLPAEPETASWRTYNDYAADARGSAEGRGQARAKSDPRERFELVLWSRLRFKGEASGEDVDDRQEPTILGLVPIDPTENEPEDFGTVDAMLEAFGRGLAEDEDGERFVLERFDINGETIWESEPEIE